MEVPAQIKQRKVWEHFWRFLVIGTLSAVVDYGVYISLTRGTDFFAGHLLAANTIAFLVANVNSFYCNRQWNFGSSQPVKQQYLQFVLVSLIYLSVIQLLFWLLVSYAGVFDLLAKAMAIGGALSVYFTVLRQWVFAGPASPVGGV